MGRRRGSRPTLNVRNGIGRTQIFQSKIESYLLTATRKTIEEMVLSLTIGCSFF